MNPTLYDILGVSPDASRDEIRAAWRAAVERFEPGEGGSSRQFRLFNEAAEVLLDPERRRAYDAELPVEEERNAPRPPAGPEAEPATSEDSPAGVVPGPPMPGAASVAAPEQRSQEDPAPAVEQRAAGQGTGSERLSGRMRTLLVVAGILAAVAVGLGAYFGSRGWAAWQAEQEAERLQDSLNRAPAAAERAAEAVLSYDYRSLEADRDAAAQFLTEDYREEYVRTFDELVVDSATDSQASVQAQILASAPMLTGGKDVSRVPVLLFVNQETTNATAAGEPSVALNRVRLDMVEVDGTWLVDEITSY